MASTVAASSSSSLAMLPLPSQPDDLDTLEMFFYQQSRAGKVPDVPTLRAFAKSQGMKGMSNAQFESLKSQWEVTAIHTEKRKRDGYVGSAVSKLGCIFVDCAEYKKNLRVANGGKCYLLVGVEALTEKLSCIPLSNKTQQSWESAIMYMVRHVYPVVTTIVVDRDVAIAGKAFQDRMKRDHNIDFFHLRTRSKSYKSERQIRTLKHALSVALGMNKKGDNKWIDKLEGILASYNARHVKGTQMRRDEVTKDNVMELLAQKFQTREFGVYFNNAVVSNFSAKLRKGLGFKYSPGQRVLLTRAATYESGQGKVKGAFDKKSVDGTFSRTVYVVDKAFLKDNSQHTLNMMYTLKTLEGDRPLFGIYYQSEITPALFAGRAKKPWEEGAAAVKDPEEQAQRDKAAAARRRKKRLEA
jgi:hypothetical protein